MDPQRLKEAYVRLQSLDERLTHKIRPRHGSMMRPNQDQLDQKLRDLATYTIELKEIVHDLFHGLAGRSGGNPPPPPPPIA
ncbi:MAG: hypothetical protein AAF772_05245 [Acidobacteriota bacterium]